MITQAFATKIGMRQAWSKSGKRISISRLKMEDAVIVGKKTQEKDNYQALQVAFGTKKLANMTKPLRTIITKSGFSLGRKFIREVRVAPESFEQYEVGKVVPFTDILKVGDIVNVQGTTKGKGFTGGMKRWGFHGGPKTHGQSDRGRAPGSIGSGTTPGRVYKGKRMAGHHGDAAKTITNLQIVHLDPETQEVWVSGSVPGHFNSAVRLSVVSHKEFEGLKGEAAKATSDKAAEPREEVTPEETVAESQSDKATKAEEKTEPKTEEKVEVKEEQPKEEKKTEKKETKE